MQELKVNLLAEGLRIVIVASRFNEMIVDRLIEAHQTLSGNLVVVRMSYCLREFQVLLKFQLPPVNLQKPKPMMQLFV